MGYCQSTASVDAPTEANGESVPNSSLTAQPDAREPAVKKEFENHGSSDETTDSVNLSTIYCSTESTIDDTSDDDSVNSDETTESTTGCIQNEDLEVSALNIHNEYRSKHFDTGPLTLSAECCATAQFVANKAIFRRSPAQERNNCGESLMFHSRRVTKREAVKRAIHEMYDQIEHYSYKNPSKVPEGKEIGNFTQVFTLLMFNF